MRRLSNREPMAVAVLSSTCARVFSRAATEVLRELKVFTGWRCRV